MDILVCEEIIWWGYSKLPPYETAWAWSEGKSWYAKPEDGYQALYPSNFTVSSMDEMYPRIADPRLIQLHGPVTKSSSLTDILLS